MIRMDNKYTRTKQTTCTQQYFVNKQPNHTSKQSNKFTNQLDPKQRNHERTTGTQNLLKKEPTHGKANKQRTHDTTSKQNNTTRFDIEQASQWAKPANQPTNQASEQASKQSSQARQASQASQAKPASQQANEATSKRSTEAQIRESKKAHTEKEPHTYHKHIRTHTQIANIIYIYIYMYIYSIHIMHMHVKSKFTQRHAQRKHTSAGTGT